MLSQTHSRMPDDAPLPFARILRSENDLLRSAAIRALPALIDTAPDAVRAKLIDALIDPDPDVRSDAMEALSPIALP